MGKKVKSKELSLEERGMIVGLHTSGWSLRKIAVHMKCGKSTVSRTLQKHLETGSLKIFHEVEDQESPLQVKTSILE